MAAFWILLAIVLGVAAGVAAFFIVRAVARRKIFDSLQTSLFLVRIPKAFPDDKAGSSEGNDFKTELAHFEQLLGSLAAIRKPFTFEVAVPHVGEEIHFYLGVPKLSS